MKILTLAFLVLVQATLAVELPQVIGHVIETGTDQWCDQRYGYAVSKGYAIMSDSRIVHESEKADDFLRFRLYADGQEHKFECSRLNCTDPLDFLVQVPEPAAKDKRAILFLRAVYGVIEDTFSNDARPARSFSEYARAISPRGHEALSDNLAVLSSRGIDLSHVLSTLPKGDYLLELCPITSNAEVRCNDHPLAFSYSWQPVHSTPWRQQDLRPGLYQLNLCKTIGDRTLRSGDSAWILLVDSAQAAKASAEYLDAIALTSGWDRGESVMLLRAYMQHISAVLNR